jgi:hypothetical protein
MASILAILSACTPTTHSDRPGTLQDSGLRLSESLAVAVRATDEARSGVAPAEAGRDAIARSDDALGQFARASNATGGAATVSAAGDMLRSAGKVIELLEDGDPIAAEAVRSSEFIPAWTGLARSPSRSTEPIAVGTPTDPEDRPSARTLVLASLLFIATIGATGLPERGSPRHSRSGRRKRIDETTETGDEAIEPEAMAGLLNVQRISPSPRPCRLRLDKALDAIVGNFDPIRSQITVMCPEVEMNFDLFRFRRVISDAICSALLRGAGRVGIVVDDMGDRAVISIADDTGHLEDAGSDAYLSSFVETAASGWGRSGVRVTRQRDEDMVVVTITIDRQLDAGDLEDPAA